MCNKNEKIVWFRQNAQIERCGIVQKYTLVRYDYRQNYKIQVLIWNVFKNKLNIQFDVHNKIDKIFENNKIKRLTIEKSCANIILTKEKHLIKEEHQNWWKEIR